MINYGAIMREKYDDIMDMTIDMIKDDPSWDMDLYLYPDGTLEWFSNPGGNSCLTGQYCIVFTINNSCFEYRLGSEEFDEYINNYAYDEYSRKLDDRIASEEDLEREDEWR